MSNFIELRAEGLTIEDIAKATDTNPQDVINELAKKKEDLISLTAVRTEAELNRCGVTRKGRLKTISSLRDKLQAELNSRNFADIPTDKLIMLLLKVNEDIRAEVTPPRIISEVNDIKWGEIDKIEIDSNVI